MTKPLVIAHQLDADLVTLLKPGLPPDVELRALLPALAWDVPDDATILISTPPRGGNVVVPENAPARWPRGLQWVHSVSAGMDEYPQWIYGAPAVTCGRGTNAVPISEFAMGNLLVVEKKLTEIWVRDAADWKPRALGTLHGKTLGLIGYGNIGQAIAARALPFGMKICAARRSAAQEEAGAGIRFAGLDEVLAEADHLVIALPLTSATAGLIGRAALAKVKPGVHLVNISRGKILDHDALVEALDDHRVGFATLDVTDPEPLPAGHPLYQHPRVHLSPHISWSDGRRGQSAMAFFKENLQRFIAGQDLKGLVNPDLKY